MSYLHLFADVFSDVNVDCTLNAFLLFLNLKLQSILKIMAFSFPQRGIFFAVEL